MAGPTASLFSLEIVVDCVENSLVFCHVPAIAFRLLDFPTLIIRSDEKESPNYLNGFYPIQSGKSCLFKMSKEMLLSRLQSTPLYIMLVDISPNKTKLLASTTISLTKCFENVLESIQRNGLDVPAVHGRQGVFELYNLMGTQVASVKLTYRMFSLGGTINGHVQQCISSANNLKKEGDSRRNKDPRKKGQTSNHNQIIDEDFEVKDSENEKDSGNGKETEMFPSSLRCEVETQTYICNKDDIISTVGLKENVNIARPPPLYYNSQSTVAYSKAPLQQYRTSSPEKNIDKVIKQTPEKNYKTVAIQTSCSGQRNAEVVLDIPRIENDERAQLADLPLINALLSELSLAKQSWMNTAAHTNNNNRGLPTTHTQDTIPALVFQPNKKSLKQKEKVEVPSNRKPILKPRATKPVTKGVLIQRNYTKFKKTSLKCGTTKTQKLREALNKKTSHSNDRLRLCNIDEEKRPLVNSQDLKKNEKTKLVASEMKETREFGCQVHVAVTCSDEQGTSENGQKYMPLKTNHDEQLPNIVERNDLPPVSGQTYSKDIVPSSSKYDSSKVGIADDPTQDGHDDNINKLLNLTAPTLQDLLPPESDLELSSHSKKSSTSSAYTISQGSVKPTFSHFSPNRAKNARYSNDEWSNKAKSTDSASSGGESGLVGKPINQLSLNSTSEHNYSDNFDSLASEQSDN